MSFLRLLIYLILFLFCSHVTSGSATKKEIIDYRKQIITGGFNPCYVKQDSVFDDIIKGTDGVGKFIQYATDSIEVKKAFVVYRHAQTPKSEYINPSHSTTDITQEGHIYSKLLGIVFQLVAQNNSVSFLAGDTRRNVQTQNDVVTGFTEGKDNIQSLIHNWINELKLGKYEEMIKKEVLNDREFLETVSSLGLFSGAEKSIPQSFVEFCSAISEYAPNENKCEKFIRFVCSNSALMAVMTKFASGSKTINIPDNLAFFILVPDYEKNIIYMCSPKLAEEILLGLKSEASEAFANRFKKGVANLLGIEKDTKLVEKIYTEMFIQNWGKIFNLDGNYITFGKKLSEDTLDEIKGIMYPIVQTQ